MLEKPDLQDQIIISRVQDEYNLHISQLTFLPLGADVNTAVFHVVTHNGTAYFLKLRSGAFDEITVSIPRFLNALGVTSIIAPLETQAKQLWANLNDYKMVLYQFIEGVNAYNAALTDHQWLEFGAALRRIHTSQLPAALSQSIPRETFSPQWREMVISFQAHIDTRMYVDPVAAQLAAFMQARRKEIDFLLARTNELARDLQARKLEMVLCHSDIHPGNLLLAANQALYIVDWDNPTLAPKERDLQLIGGCMTWHTEREEALFYQGYGVATVDPAALTYYRYERIIEDIAAYCQQLLLSDEGGKDREQSLTHFLSIFLPGHEIEIATHKDISKKY